MELLSDVSSLSDFGSLHRIGERTTREGQFYGANSIVCAGTFHNIPFALKVRSASFWRCAPALSCAVSARAPPPPRPPCARRRR